MIDGRDELLFSEAFRLIGGNRSTSELGTVCWAMVVDHTDDKDYVPLLLQTQARKKKLSPNNIAALPHAAGRSCRSPFIVIIHEKRGCLIHGDSMLDHCTACEEISLSSSKENTKRKRTFHALSRSRFNTAILRCRHLEVMNALEGVAATVQWYTLPQTPTPCEPSSSSWRLRTRWRVITIGISSLSESGSLLRPPPEKLSSHVS